ncbi:MAG: DEAD/DEAH box helicase [archaeon]|nr:DEAD/DEAH box helicase [archaeon]
MYVDEISKKYPVLEPVVDIIKNKEHITELFPPQAAAIESGYLDGKNMLLTIPTSSGKTLVAEFAALKTVLDKKKKVLYLVPLKALAMEKFNDFKEKYESLGVKTAVSVGNFDSGDQWLKNFDIIITSVEKADSLLRHRAPWFSDVGLVIADEIHLLDDPSRGPTLEIVLTRIGEVSKAQVIGLSATISNRAELAEWLDATLVESDYRPTVLYEGYAREGKVVFPSVSGQGYPVSSNIDMLAAVIKKIGHENKQGIVFVSSKRGAEKTAEDLSKVVAAVLSSSDKFKLETLSASLLRALQSSTTQCRRLSRTVRQGVAFHHSGLVHDQKAMIEDAFRSGIIRFVCATTTLAYGMNLPCDYVVMKSVKRFYGTRGYDYIPVLEYKQCVGRAGRVKYSREGRSVIITKTDDEVDNVKKIFIDGLPESIYSKLSLEPVLRIHILSLIATGHIDAVSGLETFMSKTFYAHQFKDLGELFFKVKKILGMLCDFDMVQVDKNNLKSTYFGVRVAELYLDPLTANLFARAIRQPMIMGGGDASVSHCETKNDDSMDSDFISGAQILERKSKVFINFSILNIISQAIEMQPLVRAKKDDMEMLEEIISSCFCNILTDIPSKWELDRKKFLDSLKTALLFDSWIKENTEDFISKRFSVTPGELKIKLDNADWLLYSIEEFSRMFELGDIFSAVKKLRLQMKYGVLEELLKLVKIKGIGRVRARMLYDKGFKSGSDIKKADFLKLEKIVGKKTAMKLKGLDKTSRGKVVSFDETYKDETKVAQKSLFEF